MKLEALCISLQRLEPSSVPTVYDFLDECVIRLVTNPLQYYDQLKSYDDAFDEYGLNKDRRRKIDLLFIVLLDQWQDVNVNMLETARALAPWLSVYLRYAKFVQNDDSLFLEIRQRLLAATREEAIVDTLRKTTIDLTDEVIIEALEASRAVTEHVTIQEEKQDQVVESEDEPVEDFRPPKEPEDHPELYQWTREDIQDAISSGMIGDVCFDLCSQNVATRKEALTGLRLVLSRLKVWKNIVSGDLIYVLTLLRQRNIPTVNGFNSTCWFWR